jgi:cell wall-associated NlpC family hydrolase
MRETIRRAGFLLLVCVLACTAACTGKSGSGAAGDKGQPQASSDNRSDGSQQHAQSTPSGVHALGTDNAIVPISTINNTNYVPLRELANVLQFRTNWDSAHQKLRLGDIDAPYEIRMNSKTAVKDGDEITLRDVPVLQGDTAYLPVSSLSDLFHEEMSYEVKNKQLIIHPSNVRVLDHMDADDPGQADDELNFAEDPNDPFKGAAVGGATASGNISEEAEPVWSPDNQEPDAIPAVVKNIDMDALIQKGMQYIGVPYLFAAPPYEQSGKFDCSSFTRYIYGKFGIQLPRSAREQARLGTIVSRTSLRKGDLLFFYVPGRFKSNQTVGHVGIYIGNMQMLHALPNTGVQITNIDKPYWKRVFLFAKRIVQ